MENIYESGAYADNNPTWHEEDSSWKARHIERIIVDNNIGHDSIVEIGCGTGEILLNLERAFPESQLIGYDISPQALDRAKSKETGRTSFHLRDITEEDTEEHDVALVIDVIEHVEDYMAFIRKIRPVARYKIFHIPLDLSIQSLFRQWPIQKLRESVGHLHYFFKDSALGTLRHCGYSIIDYRYTASRLELPNQAFTSRLMRWPRRILFSVSPHFAVRVLGGYSLLVLAR